MKKRETKEVALVAATTIAAILIGSGCTFTNPFERKPIRLHEPVPYNNASYKYYVIDANADEPDAFFETFDEASVYKKTYADHHEYVIVKINETYKVYNMEPIKNDVQTVQKSK
jgi:hypothetical protein